MRTITLLYLLLISFNYSISQVTYEPHSTITSAILYETGAMVTRTLDTKNIKSDGVIVIDSLPQSIVAKSIQAKCGTGLKIISIKNTYDEIRISDNAKSDSLNLLLEIIQDSLDYQSTLLKSIKKEIEVILKNDKFINEEGTNMEQLVKASNLYKTRLRALNLEQLSITKKQDKFHKRQRELRNELNGLRVKYFNNHGVEIKVEYISETDKSMTLAYFTSEAYWYTFYDLRVTGTGDNSYLDHKAYVSQSTGEDWKNVQLTLSNRNPNKRIAPPKLTPYILQNIKHLGYHQNTSKYKFKDMDPKYFYGLVLDETGEPLIGANVLCKSTNEGVITDISNTNTHNTCVLILLNLSKG